MEYNDLAINKPMVEVGFFTNNCFIKEHQEFGSDLSHEVTMDNAVAYFWSTLFNVKLN